MRLAIAFLALLAFSAEAATPDINLNTFHPANGGDGLMGVEGARPPGSDDFPIEGRLLLDYSTHLTGTPGVLDRRVGGWAVLQAHVFGPLSLAAQLPFTFSQSTFSSGVSPISVTSGIGDLRVVPRLSLLRQEKSGVNLAVQAAIDFGTGVSGSFTTDGKVTGEGLVAISRHFGPSVGVSSEVIGNLFVRFRPDQTFNGAEYGDMLGARLGGAIFTGTQPAYVPHRIYIELETSTSLPEAIQSRSSPSEARAGAGWCFGKGFTFDVTGGTAIVQAVGTPEFRLVGGIGYQPSACKAFPPSSEELAEKQAAADKMAADKAAADKAAADKLAAEKAAADKAAADKAAADQAAADQAAADKAAADKAAADAILNADRDHDGVPDRLDNCPDEPGPAENQGCPLKKKQLVAVRDGRIDILDKVKFATGKSTISPASFKLLDQVSAVLTSHPELTKIQIQGHTDNVGNAEKNTALSQKRAQAVLDYVAKKGVAKNRLEAKGFGPSQPVAGNDTKEGREQNRRVEFKVLESSGPTTVK